MDRVAYVYNHDVFAGMLRELDSGYQFVYDSEYASIGSPIGFNFPFSQLEYYSAELFPLFENLLSEGWLLGIQTRMQHIDSSDSFKLLMENGKDLLGSITVLKERK